MRHTYPLACIAVVAMYLAAWLSQLTPTATNTGASFLIVGQGFLSSDEFYAKAAANG